MSTVRPPDMSQRESAQRPETSKKMTSGVSETGISALIHPDNSGYLTAGIGSAVALLAFFALPFASIWLVAVTGLQTISVAERLSWGWALWTVPIGAGVALIAALVGIFTRGQNARASAMWIMLAGGVVGVIGLLFILFSLATTGATGLLDIGFWLALLATAVIVVGGFLQYRLLPRAEHYRLPPVAHPTA